MTDMETPTVTVGRTQYRVTRTGNDKAPYELHGPRGAHYGLMRNVPNPQLLFLFNMRGFTKGTPDWWFTDKDDELRLVG